MAGNLTNGAVSLGSSLPKLQALNGIFAVYKRQGPTSADVLNTLKEALLKEAGISNSNPRKRKKQFMKMGHGGTLDSAASGVLVVGVGNGTKMLSAMLSGSKKYVAVGELGKATDTLDATGSVTLQKDFEHITRSDMEEKLKGFVGDIMQVPPLYSALKKDGQRLSVLLKQGHKVEAKPARAVTVYGITLQDFSAPLFTLDIECGGGFYIRSLVDDLGKALSSCAHVKSLTRTKQGPFTLEDALQEEQWTLEHVLRVLKPCPDGPSEPCPESDQKSTVPSEPCPKSDQKSTVPSELCPESGQKSTVPSELCPESDQKSTVPSEPCPKSDQRATTPSESCLDVKNSTAEVEKPDN